MNKNALALFIAQLGEHLFEIFIPLRKGVFDPSPVLPHSPSHEVIFDVAGQWPNGISQFLGILGLEPETDQAKIMVNHARPAKS